jgi:hypothetical protein
VDLKASVCSDVTEEEMESGEDEKKDEDMYAAVVRVGGRQGTPMMPDKK